MSREHPKLKRINIGTVAILKYEIFDLNGSTSFALTGGGSWVLYDSRTGVSVANGNVGANNSDVDRSGNTINTITITVDLTTTDNVDVAIGPHYLVITTILTSGQTDRFRIPIEIIDLATQGVN